ncbi:MAG: putative SAM-dependent methyltransferase [Candidatus Parcubacteria bacterium]|nr:putative SAM-dependent methyltransferase [Candidatus Parcubacteria bacterium]
MSLLKHPISLLTDRLLHKVGRLKTLTGDYRRVRRQFDEFRASKAGGARGFSLNWKERWLIAGENTNVTRFSAHYIYHPAWAARVVARTRPQEHVDISSTLHFCSIVSAFVPVKFYDYRPANIHLSNLFSGKADLTALPFETGSIQSLSCMHTIEHIGLGRYGDPIDPDGDLKSIKELQRVLKPGGSLLFVVPVGRPRIIWNAHRIYSHAQVLSYFTGFDLKEFYLIPDNAAETSPIEHATQAQSDAQKYGCGCFWFVKK